MMNSVPTGSQCVGICDREVRRRVVRAAPVILITVYRSGEVRTSILADTEREQRELAPLADAIEPEIKRLGDFARAALSGKK